MGVTLQLTNKTKTRKNPELLVYWYVSVLVCYCVGVLVC